jgi:hypothetical protein
VSLITLLDRRSRINAIPIDVSDAQIHRLTIDVVRQAVESPGLVTNAIIQPRELEIEGRVVSNPAAQPFLQIPGRAAQILAAIDRLARLKLPVVVSTPLRTYPAMLISSIEARPERLERNGLRVSIRLEQARFAYVDVSPDVPTGAADGVAGEVDLGSIAAEVLA